MIILCGIPSETPLAMIRQQLEKICAPYVVFNQRLYENTEMSFEITPAGQVIGILELENRTYRLEDISGVYLRLMDDRLLPELNDEPPHSQKRRFCRSLHDTLIRWSEITPARVINRYSAMSSNFSKPYQAQLILAHGFSIPETLITNDPDLVHTFLSKHGRIVFKSISGIRSIVQTLEDKDLKRLDLIRCCPTQFQEFVEGIDIESTCGRHTSFRNRNKFGYNRLSLRKSSGKTSVLKGNRLAEESC